MKFKSKADSRIMRAIGFFSKSFLTDFWTTVGDTIYYPTSVKNPLDPRHGHTVTHERVHIKQYKKYTVPLFLFLYLFFPAPVFFAYFRWKFEREAYLVELELGATPEDIAEALHTGYFRPWIKSWMIEWLHEQKEKMVRSG